MPRIGRRLSPGIIAGGYAVVGLLWIVTSDLLLEAVGFDISLSLVKGIGFVLVTGGLLHTLLHRREIWLSAARRELGRWVQDPPPADLEHLRVLLIDDDATDRETLRQAMRLAAGPVLDVEVATNAAEARSAILRRDYDVVLIDDRLPGSSGLELVEELHEVASGPMIIITAVDDPELDRAALRAGAHDYLLKGEIQASWIGRTLRYAVSNWRAQREIAQTRQRYSEIVNEAPIGLFRSTPDGSLTEANPALLSLFGATNISQLRAVGLLALYRDPADRAQMVARIQAGETVEDEDIEMQRLDGTAIDVRMRMRGIAGEDGVIALYGALVDVTAELRNARRIRTQASMLDQVNNAVVGTDLEGRIVYWNPAAEKLFSWPRHEAIGRRVLELIPAPEETARAGEILRSMAENGSWEGEYRCRRKSGSTFPAYLTNVVLTGPDGQPTGYVGIGTDLTDLHLAEERAAAQEAMAASVLESVHFPAAVLDTEGTITAVNGAWVEVAAANEAELTTVGVGVNYLSVCDRATGPDAPAVGSGIRSVLTGEATSFAYEYPCGSQWFRLEVARAAEPLGGAVTMHIDITELREATRQAEEFARSKDRLIASVSHELRTPLTAVLGFADLIEHPEGFDTAEVAQFAKEIHRQATDMAAIVEDLLVAARAEMGALTIQLGTVDANEEIREVIRHMMYHPSVTIIDRTTPIPPVRADPLRLRQVLRNLLNNAIRYGGSRVWVETAHDGSDVEIRVVDDGEGIPEELAEAIFAPFFSAHDRSGQPDSLGLGLSVVRTLTEAMNGTAAVTTSEGRTAFVIRLQQAET
jgi:PAS domain S-box-containing protein